MSDQRQELFLQGSIPRAIFNLSLPIISANVLQAGYQLTDTFWVGRLGASAVAAVSVSTPVTFLVIAVGAGLSMAGATLTAQYMGAGLRDRVNHVAAQTLLMVTLLSLVLSALGIWLSPHILSLLGVTPEVYDGALGFMRVSFVGVIFVFNFAMFQSLLRGVGETRIPLIIVAATVVLNFGLDPLFIFGIGPFEGLGVTGAALATLTTQALATVLGLWILARGEHGIKLHARSFKLDVAYMRRAFALGFPGSVELSTRSLGLMMMSFLVATFGTLPLAAYGIGSNILQVVMIPGFGLSMAVSTLVGQNLGAGNIQRASHIAVLASIYGMAGMTAVGVGAWIWADELVAFFVPGDLDVITEGAHFIRIMALSWGGIGVQLCILSVFRASGNMMVAMVIAIVSQWMIQFPLAYVLSTHTTLASEGIWWSYPATNALVALIAIVWFAQGKWKETKLTEDDRQTVKVIDETLSEEGYR